MLEIPSTWSKHLKKESEKSYFQDISNYLEKERNNGEIIYPKEKNTFNSLEKTPFKDIKVVIIGQDPYHQKGQAHGLSFSVPEGTKIPPSLRNIFKEMNSDIGKEIPSSGNLEYLASQGVLLLNSILTVRDSSPASHSKIGWNIFTDEIIKIISKEKEDIIFLLWGAFAITKQELINEKKHFILTTTHPSPFSAHRGFLGSKHFSKTNEILRKIGKNEINW